MASAAASHAEYVVTDAGRVHAIPSTMSYDEAACLPIALQTMHNAIVTIGQLSAGESLLIQGASSGVGLMGLQIGRTKGASLVIGTSTTPARVNRLAEFGCHLAINSRDENWYRQVMAATGDKGVNLIIDQVSGSAMNQNLQAASLLGRIVNVGRLGGMVGQFDFDLHALKRISYTGVTFRSRTLEEIRQINSEMRADLWGHVEAGKLGLPIDKTFALSEIAKGMKMMAANQHFGKIVIHM
jgi:NADPH2:quinone reductase